MAAFFEITVKILKEPFWAWGNLASVDNVVSGAVYATKLPIDISKVAVERTGQSLPIR